MNVALYHIFKKNIGFILVLMLLLCGGKGISFFAVQENRGAYEYFDQWSIKCANMSPKEIDEFIEEIGAQITGTEVSNRTMVDEYFMLISSNQYKEEVYRLIDFAKNKGGLLPTALPYNYSDLLGYYEQLEYPSIINNTYLDSFFELQKFSLVFFIILFLNIIFWGKYYESGMYRYIDTTPYGEKYHKTMRISILCLSYISLFANEVFDLFYSGLLKNSHIWNASVQSYRGFFYSQNNTTIFWCFVLIWISKIFFVYIINVVTETVIKISKDTKDSIIYMSLWLIAIYLFIQAIADTRVVTLLQWGIVDWKNIVSHSIHLSSMNISTLELGCLINCIIGLLLITNRCQRRKRI